MNKNRMGTVSVMIVGAILLIVFLFIAYAALDSGRPQIVLPDSGWTNCSRRWKRPRTRRTRKAGKGTATWRRAWR